MHWFPRAFLSASAGWLAASLAFPTLQFIDHYILTLNDGTALTCAAPLWLGTYLLSAVVYGRMLPDRSETRCRKCGYILRGITEPRCPECGERI